MRIATFNILSGRSITDGRVDVDRFAAAVATLDADVLALQEVDRGQARSGHADLTAIAAEAMGAREHRFVATVAGTPGGEWSAATGDEPEGDPAYGVALLSRLPVRRWDVTRMRSIPVALPMWVPGAPRPIIVHEEPRAAVRLTIDTENGELTVVGTHLSFVPGWNRRQLRGLAEELAAVDGPVVLMGDLNLRGDRPARITGYRSLATAPTYPSNRPVFQLDHVLGRGAVGRVDRVDTPAVAVSDHRPLVVDLG